MPTLEYLLGIQAVSERRGYAAGTGGTMLRTADGGTTWKKVATAPRATSSGCTSRVRPRAGRWRTTASRVTGTVQHTTDGGATWTPQTTAPGTLLYAVDSVGQDVWVAGGDPSAGPVLGGERVSGDGVLLHSPDGGATWETQWGGGAADLRLSDVDMLDGRSAGRSATGPPPSTRSSCAPPTAATPGRCRTRATSRFDLAAVHVLDAQTAWVVGDGEQILRDHRRRRDWTTTGGDVVGPRHAACRRRRCGAAPARGCVPRR